MTTTFNEKIYKSNEKVMSFQKVCYLRDNKENRKTIFDNDGLGEDLAAEKKRNISNQNERNLKSPPAQNNFSVLMNKQNIMESNTQRVNINNETQLQIKNQKTILQNDKKKMRFNT